VSSTSKAQSRDQHSKFDLSSIWFAFRRKWFLIIFFGATLCVGTGYCVWRFLPPPKATANVVVELLAASAYSTNPTIRVDPIADKATQQNLVTKRSVLNNVLNTPGIMDIKECANAKDPYRWLEDVIKIDFRKGKEFMRISVDLEKPQDALALIKAIEKHYMFESVDKDRRSKSEKRDNVAKQKAAKEKALDEKFAELRDLTQKGATPSDKVAALHQELIQGQLNAAKAEQIELGNKIRRFRIELAGVSAESERLKKADPPEHLVEAELNANQELKAEREHLAALERAEKEYRETLNPGVSTPKLAELQQAVAIQKAKVQELPQRLLASAKAAAKAKHSIATGSNKESLESQLATAVALETKLAEDVQNYAKSVQDLNSTQHDFEKSRNQIAELRNKTESLDRILDDLTVALDAPDRVAPFQEATVSMPDDFTRRVKFSLIGALAGLFLGSAPIWFVELRRRIFHEESQLVEAVHIPLIGTIPHIPKKRRANARDAVVAQPRMRALVTESIDSARATVLFKLQENGGRSVMITSSVAGEAKSSVSGHIAISLARAGFRTLIIDSDMRRPTLHRVFGVQKEPGFNDVLLGKKDLMQVAQHCQLQNLTVLSAGEWTPAASSSLASGAWTELLAEAKDRFDIVVVDSPPVLLVADALTMARDVDALLISTLKDVSEIDLVNKSIQKLESLGISPMGMIASGMTHRTYTSRYYDRYAPAYSQRGKR
jgi:succinoglycan biosynthesis transport protein ExoP